MLPRKCCQNAVLDGNGSGTTHARGLRFPISVYRTSSDSQKGVLYPSSSDVLPNTFSCASVGRPPVYIRAQRKTSVIPCLFTKSSAVR
jgi:hypothetical protein